MGLQPAIAEQDTAPYPTISTAVQSLAIVAIATTETRHMHAVHDEVMRRLLQIMKARDPSLREHGARTARYAAALGRVVGLSSDELTDLARAALLEPFPVLRSGDR
jgi:HD-GYP domain-containing protein (c-di-GMP phosphodiesterase class II)